MSLAGYAVIALAIAESVSATGNESAVDISGYTGEGRLVLSSAAGTGTTPTSTTKIQDSADGSTGWADTGYAFAPVTNAAASHQAIGVDVDRFRKFIRVVDTLGGTTPVFVRSVSLVAKLART